MISLENWRKILTLVSHGKGIEREIHQEQQLSVALLLQGVCRIQLRRRCCRLTFVYVLSACCLYLGLQAMKSTSFMETAVGHDANCLPHVGLRMF